MAELSGGITALAYVESPHHEDNGVQVIHIRFSDDYGATWSAEDTYIGGAAVSVGLPAGAGTSDAEGPGEVWLMVAPNGDLLMTCSHVDYTVSANGAYINRSTDGGQTWGGWSKIDFSDLTDDDLVDMPGDHTIVGSDIYASLIVLQDETWATTKVGLVKSTDNGTTWSYVSDIASFSDNILETGIEYIGSNTIIAVIRDTARREAYQRISTDLGSSWGTLTKITDRHVGIAGKPVLNTLAHLKGEANWWNDPILILEGFVHQVSGSSHPRRNCIWISLDAGQTWSFPFFIDSPSEDAGYGDIIYDPDNDQFVVVSYQGTLTAAVLKQYNLTISGV